MYTRPYRNRKKQALEISSRQGGRKHFKSGSGGGGAGQKECVLKQ